MDLSENGAEASRFSGPVAEGLPSLAARVQAWGGDARRRPHSYRVVRHSPALPVRRRGARGLLEPVLAFRHLFGGRFRLALERERGLPEHPPLHGHLPGRSRVQRDGHGGRRALYRRVRNRPGGLRPHGVQPRSALRSAHGVRAGLRAARRSAAISQGVLRDVFERGRTQDADGHRGYWGAWGRAGGAHLAHGRLRGPGRRLRQPLAGGGRQAHRGRASAPRCS